MFDECELTSHYLHKASLLKIPSVVEHTTAPTAGLSHGALALPQLDYEGFEPSPYGADGSRAELEDMTGPVSPHDPASGRELTLNPESRRVP